MAKALRWTAGVLAAAFAGCNPFGGGVYHCETSDQCNADVNGVCQPDGLCSYPDLDCPSGQRYGDSAGDQSGECAVSTCFGTGLVKPCFSPVPAGEVNLTEAIDTDTSPLCATDVTGADGLCVIAGERILIGVPIAATGSRPLVLVARSTIEIGGVLDVASHHATSGPPYMTRQIGAGAGMAACDAGAAPTEGQGGGGGAGGSFGGAGGNGGNAPGGGTGGVPSATQAVATLRGGCPGQSGIRGSFGAGGHGGGVVYLIAETSIAISGRINASGEGGLGAIMGNAGAGGGGSGGMIGLDAPAIMNTGVVFANGGSGGEGSGATNAFPGRLGPEPTGAASSPPTPNSSPNGGDGGGGSAGGTAAGDANGGRGGDGTDVSGFIGGGGGGGGGTGVIKVYRGTLGGEHSPLPAP